jgi:hypothetical protein
MQSIPALHVKHRYLDEHVEPLRPDPGPQQCGTAPDAGETGGEATAARAHGWEGGRGLS